MSRFVTLFTLVVSGAGRADAPLVVRGDPLPPGAVARFGIPGEHRNEFVHAGGHTPSGSFRVAVAWERDIRVWAWQPAHARTPVHQLTGHTAAVTLVAMSPDARYVASADEAGEVRVWELATGEVTVLKKPGATVTALAVGPGGRRVVVATGRVITWHPSTARTFLVGDRQGHGDITTVAFSTDGSLLATADTKGRVIVWKPDGGYVTDLPWEPMPEPKDAPARLAPPIKQFGLDPAPPGAIDFDQGVRKLVFSPDGSRLAAAGGTVVRAWDVADRRVLWQHNRHARVYSGGLLELSGALQRPPVAPRQVGRVWDLAFSRGGHYLASSGINGDVRIVHAGHGEELREANAAKRFTGPVGLAFGPDGRSLTMFDGARKFVRETVAGGRLLGNVSGHGTAVTGLAVSPDGKWLVSADDYRRLRVWRLATGECAAEPGPVPGEGRGTAFSPDGKWLVSGGAYHGFAVLERRGDPPTFTEPKGPGIGPGRVHAFVPGHDARLCVATHYGSSRGIDLADHKAHGPGFALSDEPKALAVSPDGRWAAVTFGYAASRGPKVYSIATGKEGPALEGIGNTFAIPIAFSPDSRLVAAGSEAGVTMWEVATGKKYLHLGKHERNTEVVVFSPDGRVLASGGDRDVKLWEVATGQPLGARRADGRAVLALAFLPQPGRLASAGTDGDVLVWDVSRELREAAPVPKDLGRGVTAPAETGYWSRRFPLEGRASGVAFAPDGKTLAVGSQSGRIHLFDFATGKPTGTLDGHTSEVVAIVYAPDGKTIVSTAHLWDGKDLPVRAWDAPTGKPLWARADTRTFPTDLALPADGRTVYTTGNGGIPRWDMKTGEPLPRVKAYDQYTTAMAVSADGKYLMAGGFRDVVLWDLVRDRRVRTWRATEDDHNNTVEALAFSPDGATAVTTATDGRVRAWDVGTGERRAERATGGRVMAAAFSPEGDLLALAGEPSAAGFRVRVWDTRTWAERLRLIAHGPRVAWSPDGRWLATADVRPFEKEHYVLVWDVKALLGR